MKVTANICVRGVDLAGIVAGARDQLSQLSDGPWTIDSIDMPMGGMDNYEKVGTADGMMPMFSAYVSASTQFTEG